MTETFITTGKCSGCHACYSICPKQAISMEPDSEGFLYPCIHKDACIDCGLCKSVCPLNQQKGSNDQNKTAYAAINLDDKIRAKSSSGGVFALMAKYIISQEGVVYGAGFTDDFNVEHQRTDSDIKPLQTSKYVQSCVGNAFHQVEADLKQGRAVLFTGTPCQVAGLHSYLKSKHVCCDKLILVDLICHGVPSPMVWEKHLHQISKGRNVKSINFRDKSISWANFSLAISFQDGSCYREQAGNDSYMKGFFANLTLRPSCYNCAQKTVNRVSDLTIADCWGVEKFEPDMADQKGTSAIIVHSRKGNYLVQEIISNMKTKKIPLEMILRYNIPFLESVHMHPRRSRFFEELSKTGWEDVDGVIEQILRPTLAEKMKHVEVWFKRSVKKLFRK